MSISVIYELITIKHNFQYINVCQVPWEMVKTRGEENVNTLKIVFEPYIT